MQIQPWERKSFSEVVSLVCGQITEMPSALVAALKVPEISGPKH